MVWIAIFYQWLLTRLTRLFGNREVAVRPPSTVLLVPGEGSQPRRVRIGKLRLLIGPGIRPWLEITGRIAATIGSCWFDTVFVPRRCFVAVRAAQPPRRQSTLSSHAAVRVRT